MSSSTSQPRKLSIPTAKVFTPLLEPARYKAAYGGRGSGKSHFFADSAVEWVIQKPSSRIVCVREVQKSLKDSVKLLLEDKIRGHDLADQFEIQHDQIKGPNNGLIIFQGMSDHTADTIKSLEGFDVAYVEEAQTFTQRSLELLRPTIRKPGSELWFSWNPRHATDPVDRFFRSDTPPPNSAVVNANYTDNPWFTAELEEERAYDEIANRDRYAHVWLGAYEPQAIGAIWDRVTIEQGRVPEVDIDHLARIVVAVDPAISAEEHSDEHGIVTVGYGHDKRGYVLSDATTKGPPRKWAQRAIAEFDRWSADAIVIEINQGGDMVRNTLESVRPGLPIKEVRATRGKHVRAEPIASLYAGGRVSHVGAFPELEDQLCLFTAAGYEGQGSPDRADALVWGCTELFPQMVRRETHRKIVVPDVAYA